jgi:hypothetical protein
MTFTEGTVTIQNLSTKPAELNVNAVYEQFKISNVRTAQMQLQKCLLYRQVHFHTYAPSKMSNGEITQRAEIKGCTRNRID